jgi:flagellar biosynthesis protein FlhB
MSDKTEEPTPKRLRRALEEGDSGVSAAAAQAVGFVVAIALAPGVFTTLGRWAATTISATFTRIGNGDFAHGDVAWGIVSPILSFTAPLLLAVALTTAVVTAVQTGGAIAMKRLAPDLTRLDPIRGVRGLLSSVRALSVLRALIAAAVVALLAYRDVRAHAGDLVSLAGRPSWTAPVAVTIALGIAKWAAIVGLALGAVDLLATRRAWAKRLRMTKEEVKREHKESEGDPQIRAARQRAHQEMLAAGAAHAVKSATVVVVNPTHVACALRYDEASGDDAPVIVASGEGVVAEEIRRAARAYGIPIVQNVPLAHALKELELGTSIPETLYEAVAEVLREIMAQREEDR